MELEKFNVLWLSLNESMKQQEGLKSAVIKELFLNKSGNSLRRLINHSYFSIIIALALLPFIIWAWTKFLILYTWSQWFMPLILFFLMIGIVANIIQLIKMSKVDFANPITKNIPLVQKISIFNKYYELIYNAAGLFIYIILCIIVFTSNMKIELWRFSVLIGGFFFGAVLGIWEYQSFYRRNFNSIINSLNKLKEFNDIYS